MQWKAKVDTTVFIVAIIEWLSFVGPTSYTWRDMGQEFTLASSISWHRLGPWLHPFWLYCSQQLYWMSDLQAIFVPSRFIHGRSFYFGFHCRRRLQWIRSLCLDLWHFQWWLSLCVKDVHLREGSSQKLCSCLGICPIQHVHSKCYWHPSFRYVYCFLSS